MFAVLLFHPPPSMVAFVIDDESGEKSVSVLLNGEESELTFTDHSTVEMTVSFDLFHLYAQF